MTYVGEEGACPVCHCNFIELNGTSTTVECPVCDIEGELLLRDGKVSVSFSEEQQNRARNTHNGLREHYDEIHNMIPVAVGKLEKYKDVLPGLLEKYENFDEVIAKM